MSSPRVSVVIPAYNCAAYIGEALESVFTQSFRDLEVVVVDDGSTDGTEEALRPYLSRIVFVRQENRGAAHARNAGVARACGEYTAFLDADDVWLPEKTEAQVRALDAHPSAALVYSQVEAFDSATGKVMRIQPKETPSGLIFDDILASLVGPIPMSTVTARTAVLKEAGGFDETLPVGEDLHLWLRLAKKHEIVGIARVFTRRRLHGANISARVFSANSIDCFDRIVRLFPETRPDVCPAMKNAYRSHGEEIVRNLFHVKQYARAREVARDLGRRGMARPSVVFYGLVTALPAPALDALRGLRRIVLRGKP